MKQIKFFYEKIKEIKKIINTEIPPSEEVKKIFKKIDFDKFIKLLDTIIKENEKQGFCHSKKVIIDRILKECLYNGKNVSDREKNEFYIYFSKILKRGLIQFGGDAANAGSGLFILCCIIYLIVAGILCLIPGTHLIGIAMLLWGLHSHTTVVVVAPLI